MKGELSHGLPALATAGNRIVRADTGEAVLLRGLNRSGLEYSQPSEAGFLAAAGITREEVREIVAGWNANVIRVPFNQDWALHGRGGHSAEEYRAALDQVTEWAAALGAYTILDLQWLDADTVYGHTSGRENHVAPLPDALTLSLWSEFAARYREEPAVLFDLFNEPHDPVDDDWRPLHLIGPDGRVVEADPDCVGPEQWVPWAERLIREIHAVHPGAVILVAGVDWAFDLRGIEIDAPNIVYSAHIYANRARRHWRKALGRADRVPVFVGEWGGRDRDVEFGRRLAQALRSSACGWTAWSWADFPKLVAPPNFHPTLFGALVRNELRLT